MDVARGLSYLGEGLLPTGVQSADSRAVHGSVQSSIIKAGSE